MAGATPGGIASPPDPFPLIIAKQWFKAFEGQALGLGTDPGHTGVVESARTGQPPYQVLPLVKLPHRIPQPGELGGPGAGIRRR